MEKAKQHIQSEYIFNASILINWNDICNADINELGASLLGHTIMCLGAMDVA